MLPILTYHSLDDSRSVISIAPTEFRRQMERLRNWGFVGMSLRDYFGNQETEPSRRAALITFDDGFRNVCEIAAPVLVELGFRATVFAVAGKIGGTNDWPGDVPGVPELPLATWQQLRDLTDLGFEIGAHGMTHACLTGLASDAARREVVDAGNKIEDGLGVHVRSLAYPYGRFDCTHRSLAAERYDVACGTQLRLAQPSDDRYCLPRIDMYYLRSALAFRMLPTLPGRAYLAARSIGRGVREALSHNPLRDA